MALKAFAEFVKNNNDLDPTFFIIGKGPDEEKIKGIAKEYMIESRVNFSGYLDHRSVMQRMREADIFLYPSLRDSGGFVIVESLIAGTPVICLDIGGPGEIVTDECGIKIKPESPEQVVRNLAAALERLARNPELRRKLGEGGRKRVEEVYNWNKKGKEMNRIYDQLMGKEVS